MKTNFILKRLSSVAAPMVALMLGGSAVSTVAAAFDSPVGVWDFSISGSEKGVARIRFLNDFTLAGYEILMPGKPLTDSSRDTNPRGGPTSGSDPRTGQPGGGSGTNTFFLGDASVEGFWGFDEKGKVVGALTSTSDISTNGMSFVGTVAQGARMTLRAYDDSGRMMWRGVPAIVLPDISGDCTVTGKKGRSLLTGILSISPTGIPNYYDVVIHGPGYDGTGKALLTSNNKLGIAYQIGTNYTSITALSGTFNPTRLKGTVTGTDGTNNISLKIVQPQLP